MTDEVATPTAQHLRIAHYINAINDISKLLDLTPEEVAVAHALDQITTKEMAKGIRFASPEEAWITLHFWMLEECAKANLQDRP